MSAFRPKQGGFTLVEVMVALAILATALTVLMTGTAANVRDAQRAQMLAVATSLARGKMFDLEEELLREGFQQTEQEENGDFSDEKWPGVKWKASIRLVELPSIQNIGGAAQGAAEDAAGAEAGAENPLTGMLSSFGLGGQLDGQEAAGAGLISSQFTLFQEVLKQSIRKITLTVEWVAYGADDCTDSLRTEIYACVDKPTGCDDDRLNLESLRCERMVLDLYVTDPGAIARVTGGAAGGGAAGGGDGDDSGADADSGDGSGSGARSGGGRASGRRTIGSQSRGGRSGGGGSQ